MPYPLVFCGSPLAAGSFCPGTIIAPLTSHFDGASHMARDVWVCGTSLILRGAGGTVSCELD